jgi:hypothetical protein
MSSLQKRRVYNKMSSPMQMGRKGPKRGLFGKKATQKMTRFGKKMARGVKRFAGGVASGAGSLAGIAEQLEDVEGIGGFAGGFGRAARGVQHIARSVARAKGSSGSVARQLRAGYQTGAPMVQEGVGAMKR